MWELYTYDISLLFCFAYYLNIAFSQILYLVRKQNNFVELQYVQLNIDYAIDQKHTNSIISHHKVCYFAELSCV